MFKMLPVKFYVLDFCDKDSGGFATVPMTAKEAWRFLWHSFRMDVSFYDGKPDHYLLISDDGFFKDMDFSLWYAYCAPHDHFTARHAYTELRRDKLGEGRLPF